MAEDRRELAGWKQIAAYLEVSIPTARKYHREEGLPVLRRGKRYFARTSDLDSWLAGSAGTRTDEDLPERQDSPPAKARPILERRRFVRRTAIASGFFLVALIFVFARPETRPQRLQVERHDELLQVSDSQGRLLWSLSPEDLPEGQVLKKHLIADVDRDGTQEVCFNTTVTPKSVRTGRVTCWAGSGRVLWEFDYGRAVKVGDRVFEPIYSGQFLELLETSEGRFLMTSAVHQTWYPAQVLLLDAGTGAIVSEYWHPGYLNDFARIEIDGDEDTELLFGGVNNPGFGSGYPSLLVLDVPFRVRPARASFFDRFAEGLGFENACEELYFLLPRPDLFEVTSELSSVKKVQVHRRGREIAKVRVDVGGTHVEQGMGTYYLDSDFRVIDVRSSDTLRASHDLLANQGFLDHRFTERELDVWRNLLRFETAPDGNSPEVADLFHLQAAGKE